MEEIWKFAFGIAGIGAITSLVLWSLYQRWLTLDIFQQMTKNQQFILFIIFFVLTFLFAIFGLGCYVLVSSGRSHATSQTELKEILKERKKSVQAKLAGYARQMLEDGRRHDAMQVSNACITYKANMDLALDALENQKFVLFDETRLRISSDINLLKTRFGLSGPNIYFVTSSRYLRRFPRQSNRRTESDAFATPQTLHYSRCMPLMKSSPELAIHRVASYLHEHVPFLAAFQKIVANRNDWKGIALTLISKFDQSSRIELRLRDDSEELWFLFTCEKENIDQLIKESHIPPAV